MENVSDVEHAEFRISSGAAELGADVSIPDPAAGLVIFAHGSGSSRYSPRNRRVAASLHRGAVATILADLLTIEEEAVDRHTGELRFDIGLLSRQLIDITDWAGNQPSLKGLGLGYFGASTGAAAAFSAAEGSRGNMTITPGITFRNMDAAPDLEAAIRKEITGLNRFFDRITNCDVVIEGPRRQVYGGIYKVRIVLGVPCEELVVENNPTLHADLQKTEGARKTKKSEPHRERRDPGLAIREAFQIMRRQLQDYARRMRSDTKRHEEPRPPQ